jgi:hypothetical protein
MKQLLAGLALAAVTVSPVLADEAHDAWERATVAYDHGDYVAALKDLHFAADHGNAAAQYDIGLMYHLGQGIPVDYSEAMKWYRKAIEQGVAHAAINLGRMYAKGEGVSQDFAQAYLWTAIALAGLPPGADHDGTKKNLELDAEKLSPPELAGAKALAQEWLDKHVVNLN